MNRATPVNGGTRRLLLWILILSFGFVSLVALSEALTPERLGSWEWFVRLHDDVLLWSLAYYQVHGWPLLAHALLILAVTARVEAVRLSARCGLTALALLGAAAASKLLDPCGVWPLILGCIGWAFALWPWTASAARPLATAALVAWTAFYLVHPWRAEAWPEAPLLCAGVLGVAAVYVVLLRPHWAHLTVGPWIVRRYLAHDPSARLYLTVVAATRGAPTPTGSSPRGGAGGLGWWIERPLVLASAFAAVIRRTILAQDSRPFAVTEPALADALQRVRDEQLERALEALYGRAGHPLPVLTDAGRSAAGNALRRWVGATQALATCWELGASSTDLDARLHAAELCADASRRLSRPAHRRTSSGGRLPWLPENEVRELVKGLADQEVRALTTMNGPIDWQLQLALLDESADDALLQTGRGVLAKVAASQAANGSAPPEELWTRLFRISLEQVPQALEGSPQMRRLALAFRRKLLDCCLPMQGPTLAQAARREVEASRDRLAPCTSAQPDLRGQDRDTMQELLLRELAAPDLSQPVRRLLVQALLDTTETPDPPALEARGLFELVEEPLSSELRAETPRVFGPVSRVAALKAEPPPATPLPVRSWRDHVDEEATGIARVLRAIRRPDYFSRLPLHAGSAAALAIVAVVGNFFVPQSLWAVPDHRAGSPNLASRPVRGLAPGRESPEPSVWVASDGGVSVRGAGASPHWYSLTRATTRGGLPSDDVLRVGVPPRTSIPADQDAWVAYLCGRVGAGDRPGLILSDYPTAPPGTLSSITVEGWVRALIPTRFADLTDDRITCAWQQHGCPLMLVGTDSLGLGVYDVDRRAWTVRSEPWLPRGRVLGVTAGRVRDRWWVWAATEGGVVGGPADATIAGEWVRVGALPGLTGRPEQIAAHMDDGVLAIECRTRVGGVATILVTPDRTVSTRGRVSDETAGPRTSNPANLAYSRAGQRLWTTDERTLMVYREEGHAWAAAAMPAPATDLATVTSDPACVVIATSQGALVARDGVQGPIVRAAGLANTPLVQVVSGDAEATFPVAAGDATGAAFGLSRAEFGELNGANTARWTPLLGPSRVPGLQLRDVTSVAPGQRPDPETGRADEGLFLGTRRQGVVFLSSSSRELVPDPVSAASSSIRDVTYHDGQLWRVRADHVVERLALDRPQTGWQPVREPGSSGIAAVTTAIAMGVELFVAGQDGSVASYDMARHVWTRRGRVEGLERFIVAEDALWAHANRGALFVLDPQRGWEPRAQAVVKAEASADGVFVLDAQGAAHVVYRSRPQRTLVAPRPIPRGVAQPVAVAVDGDTLYLAFETPRPALYRYSMVGAEARRWIDATTPDGIKRIVQVHARNGDLWLVDQDQQLHRRPRGTGAWLKTQLTGTVRWSESGAWVLSKDGSLTSIDADGKGRVIVGRRLGHDPTGDVRAVVEFKGALHVANGTRLSSYSLAEHDWTEVACHGRITALLATQKFLYVLEDTGRLLRRENPTGDLMEIVDHFAPARTLPGAPPAVHIEGAWGLDGGVAVRARELGIFLLRDDDPAAPRWVQAATPGPPGDAEVTCAAESSTGDLFIGTKAHGLWSYRPVAARSPREWSLVPSAGKGPILQAEVVQSRNLELVIRTGTEVSLHRWEGSAWSTRQLSRPGSVPIALALVRGDAVIAERTAGGGVGLARVPLREGATRDLIGATNGALAATRSVCADPRRPDELLRVDERGGLARYSWREHAWAAEPLLRVRDVFSAAGYVWAWSPATRALHSRMDQDKWAPLLQPETSNPAVVTQVTWDSEGLVSRVADGSLWLHRGPGTPAVPLLPPVSRGTNWPDVRALSEYAANRFLLVGSAQGLGAYEVATHRWSHHDQMKGVRRFARSATQTLALTDEKELWAVELANEAVSVRRIELPPGQQAVSLHEVDTDVLVATSDGLGVVSRGKFSEALRGRPLEDPAKVFPALTAATEWQGKLLIAYASQGGTGRVAMYDPERLAWTWFDVAEGTIKRFHATPLGLLGELALARAQVRAPSTGLVVLTPTAATPYRPISTSLRSLAVDGACVAAISDDRRLLLLAAGPQGPELVALSSSPDTLPAEVRSAFTRGTRLLLLLEDGSLWSYSLADLRWQRQQPDPAQSTRRFTQLLTIQGNLFALAADGELFHHPFESDSPRWIRVGGDRQDAWGHAADLSSVKLDPEKTAGEDRWRLATGRSGQPELRYRPGVAGDWLVANFTERRVDFDRYERIVCREGHLWAETLAAGAAGTSERVVRRFAIRAGQGRPVLEEQDGLDRYAIPQSRVDSAFARDPITSTTFTGPTFELAPSEAPTGWVGPGGRSLRLTLKAWAIGPQELRPSSRGASWRMDVDDWRSIEVVRAAGAWRLAIATPAGVVTLDALQGGRARRIALHRLDAATAERVAFAVDSPRGGVYGRWGDTHFGLEAAGTSWLPAAQPQQAEGAFRRRSTLLDSNRHLDAQRWQVAMADGERPTLKLTLPGGPVAVELNRHGFAFDQVRAISLEQGKVVFVTPAGRVTYDRPTRGGLGLPARIDGPGLQADGLFRPLRGGDGTILIEDAVTASRAFRLGPDGWAQVALASVEEALTRERAILFDGLGWRWEAQDDRVIVQRPPFQARPLTGRLLRDVGQLSFDQTIDLATDAKERVLVLTPSGVMTWNGDSIAAADLQGEAPFVDHHGTGSFLWTPEGRVLSAAQRCFALGDAGWTAAENAVADTARTWLLPGAAWRVRRGGIVERKLPATDAFAPVAHGHERWLWDFEDVRCAAGSTSSLFLGTGNGLSRFDVTAKVEPRGAIALPEGVWRVERVSEGRLQVATAAGEQIIDEGLRIRGAAEEPFARRDSVIFQSPTLSWHRVGNSGAAVRAALNPGAPLTPVTFVGGRFDFDLVRDLEVTSQGTFLATPLGVLRADEPIWTRSLQQTTDVDVFRVWRRTTRRWDVAVRLPDRQVLALGADRRWQQDQEAAAQWRTIEDAGPTWEARRAGGGDMDLRVAIGGSLQPTRFDNGALLFDQATDLVSLDPDRVLIATRGGVLTYAAANGALVDLRAAPAGGPAPEHVDQLTKTDRGTLARVRGPQERWALRPQAELAWAPIDPADGRTRAAASRRRVYRDEQRWTIEATESGLSLLWAGEPVRFTRAGSFQAFAHDLVDSIRWHDERLWLGTAGGVVSFGTSSSPPRLEQGSLVAKPFASVVGPLQLVVGPGRRLACFSDAGERWTLDDEGWRLAPRPESAPELASAPGLWVWRGKARASDGYRYVEVELDARVFPLAHGDDPFLNGSLAFWQTAGKAGGLAYRKGWFAATPWGVAELAPDGATFRRLHGLPGSDGRPREGRVASVVVDPRSNALYARTPDGRTLVLSEDRGLEDVAEATWPGTDPVVTSAFLTFTPSAEGLQVRFSEGVSDGPPARPLLGRIDGRFAFDDARALAWWRSSCWLATPVGVVRLLPSGLEHHLAAFGGEVPDDIWTDGEALLASTPTRRVFQATVIGEARTAWQEAPRERASAFLIERQVVVRNPLVTGTRTNDRLAFKLVGDGLPPCDASTPLVVDGVLPFDDLRDAWLDGAELVVAARHGTWTYRVERLDRSLRLRVVGATARPMAPPGSGPMLRLPDAAEAPDGDRFELSASGRALILKRFQDGHEAYRQTLDGLADGAWQHSFRTNRHLWIPRASGTPVRWSLDARRLRED